MVPPQVKDGRYLGLSNLEVARTALQRIPLFDDFLLGEGGSGVLQHTCTPNYTVVHDKP